jgi:hypothetical protein
MKADADVVEMKKALAELGASAQVLAVSNIRALTVPELQAFMQRHAAATGSVEMSLVAELMFLRKTVAEGFKLLDSKLGTLESKIDRATSGKMPGGRRHRRRR